MANPTLAEFLHDFAEFSDFDTTNDELKKLVGNPALNVSLPDGFARDFKAKYMTVDQAKNNSSVKKHFTAQALNGVDAKIEEAVSMFGIPDETKKVIFDEQNSYNRISLLSKAISDMKDSMMSATGGEKKAMLEKYEALQKEYNTVKDNHKKEIEAVNGKWVSDLTNREINYLFAGYDYALGLDKDIEISTARTVWEKELAAKGGKVQYGEKGIKLVNSDTPDLPFTIDNKPVDIKAFTDAVLANNKLLKVTKPVTPQPIPAPANTVPANSAARSQVSKALADFRAGSM